MHLLYEKLLMCASYPMLPYSNRVIYALGRLFSAACSTSRSTAVLLAQYPMLCSGGSFQLETLSFGETLDSD